MISLFKFWADKKEYFPEFPILESEVGINRKGIYPGEVNHEFFKIKNNRDFPGRVFVLMGQWRAGLDIPGALREAENAKRTENQGNRESSTTSAR
jgi:hypothetical protein